MFNLAAAKERCEKATPGPWRSGGLHVFGTWDARIGQADVPANSLFIAHARTDLPEAIKEIERLQAENDSLRRELQEARDYINGLCDNRPDPRE